MGGLSGIASVFAHTPGLGLPPLPGNLGLPEKPKGPGGTTSGGRDDHGRTVTNKKAYEESYAKAETYNKAFADLLNQQSHLTGNERNQLYKFYRSGNDEVPQGGRALTDFSKTLLQLSPEQFKAQQQQQQQAEAQIPVPAPAPAQAPVPQTVGPTPKPTVVQPPATPTVATPTGNIAGKTATVGVMGADAGGRGSGRKRGRVATLLTGLGGAAEQFGA